ncbi:MAG: DDE-type integrase/transposase/recombinase [archaeon]
MQCEKLHMDELFLSMCNGFHYIWDAICSDTKYGYWFLAEKRTSNNAKKLMRMSAIPLDKLITDGFFSYIRPVKEVYGLRFYYTKYHRCESFEDKKNNNIIERLQNTLRRYLHFKRGFYSCKTGNVFLDFVKIYYNFVRNHMAIGCTPAEKAGLICFLEEKREYDRLRKLIELSFLRLFYSCWSLVQLDFGSPTVNWDKADNCLRK